MGLAFDKRLAELDAYLQMLIVENESIEKKLNGISSSATNIVERSGLHAIKDNLETLLSTVKHSIVLLQIGKVSLRHSSSSTSSESPSSKPGTPPKRPARPSKSASSTPNSKENIFKHTSNSHAPRSCDIILKSTLETGANSHWRQRQQQQQQRCEAKHSPSSSKSAVEDLTSAILDGGKARSYRSEFNARSADGSAGVNVRLASSSCDSSNVAHHHVTAAAATVAISSAACLNETGTGNSSHFGGVNCKDDDVVDEVDDDDDDCDAFYDAADEQHNRSTNSDLYGASTSKINNRSDINNRGNVATNITEGLNITSTSGLDDKESPLSKHELQLQTEIMPYNNEPNNNVNSITADGSIDWDALYEDEDEEDLGSLESHGSVIKHLLSQIRIGMDLTKVVLPTFILERRSLLEMYADFFAHPDLFSAIPDYKTPEERMIQLVRWYLSAFHAGRKSSVAKKPYNPILGEIFKCQWQLDNELINNEQRIQEMDKKSSIMHHKLTFISEQVSHHPPVSAFYAENKEKSISCCAHIYTKSKYLGLSVGVNNIGSGVINLHNHNETYVCTFPSAYGRSILTVPWVELGGPVTIVCNETGYKANIEFVTKPFYGGKKHRVMGEILRPSNERFLTIDGEWNGIMYSKSPPNMSEKEVFVDTTSLPVIKKHVGPVSTQDSFESRNVWKEVTRALKLQDITTATAAKSFIEQRQRDLLRDRLEKGVKWKTRYFEACDDGWVYSQQSSSSSGCGTSDKHQ